MKKNKWDRRKWIKILDIAIVCCVVSCLVNYEVIVIENPYINSIFEQLRHLGVLIVSICMINFNKIK
jgi:hypothetical protein